MPQRAIVGSVEAIEAFRTKLIIYLSKARPALDEVSADVMRTRLWIENDQRALWEHEFRKRAKALEQAQQELFSAKLSNLSKETAVQQFTYHRARRALEEAEQKLRILKRWRRDFDNRLQPLVKQMEKLHTVLSNDMVQAIAYLAEVVKTLDAYAQVAPASAASGAGQGSGAAAPDGAAAVSAQTPSPETKPSGGTAGV
jgi:chromosome segregation ATPase